MKKAQIQMSENVIILFIFFILLVLGIVFFTRIQGAKTQQIVEADIEGKGLQVAQKIALLPELQCTKDNAKEAGECYDEFGARAMAVVAQRPELSEYYYSLFGFSTLSIKKIFPPQEQPEQIIIYNRTKGNFTSKRVTSIPLTLCNYLSGITRDCSFAVLKVEVYN